jgi:cysteine desulfurase/selenocysteine lyase
VSEGLNIIGAALDWRRGDNVVVCRELEHPNNVFPWANLNRRLGVEIRDVRARDGQLSAEDVIAAVDERTRLVTLCEVSFSPGLRADIKAIGKVTRPRDIFPAGRRRPIRRCPAHDGGCGHRRLAVSTQKGLLGLWHGVPLLPQSWAERLKPGLSRPLRRRSGRHARGGARERRFRLMPGARRFDLGNYNFAAAGVDVSLALIDRIGTPAIEAHVSRLARRLASGLDQLGFGVAGDASGTQLAGIVSIGRHGAGGHDSSDDPITQNLAETLKRSGVRLSVRQGMVRLSFHLYNEDGDVDHVLDVARGMRGRVA